MSNLKYLKYKTKYLQIKNKLGGAQPTKLSAKAPEFHLPVTAPRTTTEYLVHSKEIPTNMDGKILSMLRQEHRKEEKRVKESPDADITPLSQSYVTIVTVHEAPQVPTRYTFHTLVIPENMDMRELFIIIDHEKNPDPHITYITVEQALQNLENHNKEFSKRQHLLDMEFASESDLDETDTKHIASLPLAMSRHIPAQPNQNKRKQKKARFYRR
jgi:hypothetical protein